MLRDAPTAQGKRSLLRHRAHFDYEVASGVDGQAITRPQQHRGRSLLDDGRPGNAVTHAEVGAVVDGGFEPAMLVVPN